MRRMKYEGLKPCPFCGREGVVLVDDFGGYAVVCDGDECFCAVGEGFDDDGRPDHVFETAIEAIVAWDKRVPTIKEMSGSIDYGGKVDYTDL